MRPSKTFCFIKISICFPRTRFDDANHAQGVVQQNLIKYRQVEHQPLKLCPSSSIMLVSLCLALAIYSLVCLASSTKFNCNHVALGRTDNWFQVTINKLHFNSWIARLKLDMWLFISFAISFVLTFSQELFSTFFHVNLIRFCLMLKFANTALWSVSWHES